MLCDDEPSLLEPLTPFNCWTKPLTLLAFRESPAALEEWLGVLPLTVLFAPRRLPRTLLAGAGWLGPSGSLRGPPLTLGCWLGGTPLCFADAGAWPLAIACFCDLTFGVGLPGCCAMLSLRGVRRSAESSAGSFFCSNGDAGPSYYERRSPTAHINRFRGVAHLYHWASAWFSFYLCHYTLIHRGGRGSCTLRQPLGHRRAYHPTYTEWR